MSEFDKSVAVVYEKYELVDGSLKDTHDDRAAIVKHSKESNKFFIKFSNQTGDFYSPWGAFSSEGELLQSVGGVPKYDWVKVTETAYNLYKKYLTTKNPAYFNRMKESF